MNIEQELAAMRRGVRGLPIHLRPRPTVMPVPVAASALRIPVAELQRMIRRMDVITFAVGGEEVLPIDEVERLMGARRSVSASSR